MHFLPLDIGNPNNFIAHVIIQVIYNLKSIMSKPGTQAFDEAFNKVVTIVKKK